MYCTLQWFKTVDHNTEAIVNEKETTCHHYTSRDLAFHCISCINKYSCTGLFPFHIHAMISKPFTGYFYLNKHTIIYLSLCKTCMSCDNFHLNAYFSLLFLTSHSLQSSLVMEFLPLVILFHFVEIPFLCMAEFILFI